MIHLIILAKDGSNVFIETAEINQLTKQLQINSDKIKKLNETYWNNAMDDIYNQYKDHSIDRTSSLPSDLDVTCSISKSIYKIQAMLDLK